MFFPTCMYTPSAYRGQKWLLDSLQVEWVALWVLGTKPASSSRAATALNHWTISLTPYIPYLRTVTWTNPSMSFKWCLWGWRDLLFQTKKGDTWTPWWHLNLKGASDGYPKVCRVLNPSFGWAEVITVRVINILLCDRHSKAPKCQPGD